MVESNAKKIRRFVRLQEGDEVGELARKVWKTGPTFHVRVRKDKDETEFIFRIPVQRRANRYRPDLYKALWRPQTKNWKHAVERAFKLARSGGKSIRDAVDSPFYQVFVFALRILYEDVGQLGPAAVKYVQERAPQIDQFAKRPGGAKSLPLKGDPARLMELAREYHRVEEEARQVLGFLHKRREDKNDEKVKKVLQTQFQFKWLALFIAGKLFEPHFLLKIPGPVDRAVYPLQKIQLTKRQVAVAALTQRQNKKNPEARLSARTLYEEYIMPGNKLLKKSKNIAAPFR